MSDVTSRLSLPYPELVDEPDIEEAVKPLAQLLDIIATIGGVGLAAARPDAGVTNRIYYATDTRMLWFDTGSEWRQVDPRGAAGGELAGTYPNPSVAPGIIVANHLNAALKPSAGAGDTAEALRALGPSPGRAAAGLHATQHGPAGSDPITVGPPNMGTTRGLSGSGSMAALPGSIVGSGTIFTVAAARGGVYQINLNAGITQLGGGHRTIYIVINGVAIAANGAEAAVEAGIGTDLSCSAAPVLAPGDAISFNFNLSPGCQAGKTCDYRFDITRQWAARNNTA